jgi:hypothetical protein
MAVLFELGRSTSTRCANSIKLYFFRKQGMSNKKWTIQGMCIRGRKTYGKYSPKLYHFQNVVNYHNSSWCIKIIFPTNALFIKTHRILQFVFKCLFTQLLHVSVPLDHHQGAYIRTLLKSL